jgi:hypothetical protein
MATGYQGLAQVITIPETDSFWLKAIGFSKDGPFV